MVRVAASYNQKRLICLMMHHQSAMLPTHGEGNPYSKATRNSFQSCLLQQSAFVFHSPTAENVHKNVSNLMFDNTPNYIPTYQRNVAYLVYTFSLLTQYQHLYGACFYKNTFLLVFFQRF